MAAILLAMNLYANWHWVIKVLTNAIVVALLFVTYHSYPGILGWPTDRTLPKQFYLHAVNVDEPTTIYLWGTDLDRGLGRTVPRSYALAYTAKLHDQVNKASRKLRKGLPVIGQAAVKTGTPSAVSEGEQTDVADSDIVFVDAPQALIPGK